MGPNRPTRAWLLLAVCLVCAAASAWLGANYIPRLSQHGGYFLVDVVDPVRAEPPAPPRSVSLVVVDGLRADSARTTNVVHALAEAGRCGEADVGSYTVSRPIYALLSTGLEVARSGARNNDETTPLRAESVWDVAAAAGVTVGVASNLPWWRELFPSAMSAAIEVDESDNVFEAATALGTEVTVIHPVYVDTTGHASGAASHEYRRAVQRVDDEASAWLAGLDLSQDLVLFTADHGHVDAGGHGAKQPEVRTVVLCIAGPGVAAGSDAERIDARVVAPAIALALGVRFPKNMRAGQDDLDQLFELFPDLPSDYRADRRRSVETFRRRNAEALGRWLETEAKATWSDLEVQEGRRRWPTIGLLLALLAAALGFSVRLRSLHGAQAARSLSWVFGALVVTAATWVVLRGSFDYTSINERTPFIRASLLICGGVGLGFAWLHIRTFADPARWAADQSTLAALLLALSLAHIGAYGWPLGFPIPHRFVLFFPFLAAVAGAVHGLLGAVAALRLQRFERGVRASSAAGAQDPPAAL